MEAPLHCPILEDCSVYLNNVIHNEMVGLTYRSLYCLQGNKKYKTCKRYHAYQQVWEQSTPQYSSQFCGMLLMNWSPYAEVF